MNAQRAINTHLGIEEEAVHAPRERLVTLVEVGVRWLLWQHAAVLMLDMLGVLVVSILGLLHPGRTNDNCIAGRPLETAYARVCENAIRTDGHTDKEATRPDEYKFSTICYSCRRITHLILRQSSVVSKVIKIRRKLANLQRGRSSRRTGGMRLDCHALGKVVTAIGGGGECATVAAGNTSESERARERHRVRRQAGVGSPELFGLSALVIPRSLQRQALQPANPHSGHNHVRRVFMVKACTNSMS